MMASLSHPAPPGTANPVSYPPVPPQSPGSFLKVTNILPPSQVGLNETSQQLPPQTANPASAPSFGPDASARAAEIRRDGRPAESDREKQERRKAAAAAKFGIQSQGGGPSNPPPPKKAGAVVAASGAGGGSGESKKKKTTFLADLSFSHYHFSSLERNHKWRLHVEPDLGIPLDLLDLSVYNAPSEKDRPPLHPADEELLRDDITPAKKDKFKPKERPSGEGLSWLVHTQYISRVDEDGPPRKKVLSEQEWKREAMEIEMLEEEGDFETREGQLRYIEESFVSANERPVHPSNKALEAVEILPILPDLSRLSEQYVQMVFDTDPFEEAENLKELSEETKKGLQTKALMKSFKMPAEDDVAEQSFVAYMLPQPQEASRGMEEGEEMKYEWVREYHWTVKKGDAKRGTFLLVYNENDITYVPLNAKLSVSKLKAKEGTGMRRSQFPVPSSVTVKRRREIEEDELEKRQRINEGEEDDEEAGGREAHGRGEGGTGSEDGSGEGRVVGDGIGGEEDGEADGGENGDGEEGGEGDEGEEE